MDDRCDAIGDADVHVHYCLTDAVGPREHADGLAILSDDERARASRLVFEADQRSFVAAHALLRRVLSLYGDPAPQHWSFSADRYGKPGLKDPPAGTALQFNLTHTRGLVACVVARASDVGIDAEPLQVTVSPVDLAERFFAPAEVAALRACDGQERNERFVETWTLKEAFIKALGVGLSHPLDSFSVLREGATVGFVPPAGHDPGLWQFAMWAPTPDYRLSVGVRGGRGQRRDISVWQARAEELLLPASPCILARFNP